MEMTSPVKSTLREYVTLAIHVSLSTLIFAILLVPVVGLHILGEYLAYQSVGSRFIIYSLESLEYMLFAVDVVFFLFSIVAQTVRTLRRTWKGDV